MEDVKAKITYAKSGFPEDSDCSTDGDSDPSRSAKTPSIAGSQNAFGNRKKNRSAHLEELNPNDRLLLVLILALWFLCSFI